MKVFKVIIASIVAFLVVGFSYEAGQQQANTIAEKHRVTLQESHAQQIAERDRQEDEEKNNNKKFFDEIKAEVHALQDRNSKLEKAVAEYNKSVLLFSYANDMRAKEIVFLKKQLDEERAKVVQLDKAKKPYLVVNR